MRTYCICTHAVHGIGLYEKSLELSVVTHKAGAEVSKIRL